MQRKTFGIICTPKVPQTGYCENSETIRSSVDSIGTNKLSHKQAYTLPYGLHISYVRLTADHLKAWLIIGADNIMNFTYVINTIEWRNSGVKCESTITEYKILNEFLHCSMGKAKIKWDSKFP
jgi:hypothetical protein